jgi:uncharacterized protein YjbI with pentapeptide repeats
MAHIENAYLSDVDLRHADITGANLHAVKFRNAVFTGVRGLTRDSFRGWKWGILRVYHILETYPDQCEPVYQALSRMLKNSNTRAVSHAPTAQDPV